MRSSRLPTNSEVKICPTCGLTIGGDVLCWGNNQRMQLGSAVAGTCTPVNIPPVRPAVNPQPVPCSITPVRVTIPQAIRVDVGLLHACALTRAGDVYCWGWNAFGQVGNGVKGTGTSAEPPTKVAGSGYSTVSAGAGHSCAIAAGVAKCWGESRDAGGLGDGMQAPHYTPLPVASAESFGTVDASNGNYVFVHSCAVTTTGSLLCWGANNHGQLGVTLAPAQCTFQTINYDCALSPLAAQTSVAFGNVTTGRGFSCGNALEGSAYCWGRNDLGQLGVGTFVEKRTPVKVLTASIP